MIHFGVERLLKIKVLWIAKKLGLITYELFSRNSGMLLNKTLEHLYISIMALILAMIVAIPLGILLSKKKLSKVSLTIAGILQTIPTLAILALMIPLFGVGKNGNCVIYICFTTYIK